VLDVLQLSEAERRAYENYNDDLHQRASMINSHYGRGRREGSEEGLKKGLKKGLREGRKAGRQEGHKEGFDQALRTVTQRLLATGLSRENVAAAMGVTLAELAEYSDTA